MGLAEPRKRMKLSHDPRNTQWSNSENSYGQRLMQQQGWKSGESLGAKGRGSKYSDSEASKVNVKYKDDTLGLGASLKSKDIAGQRTGFDAFQGLLGRLNAKTEAEVEAVEKRVEDKKLAMFAQGRWGGMVFVPGGLLVQSDPYKQVEALRKAEAERISQKATIEAQKSESDTAGVYSDSESAQKAKRKAEKKQRKEERRLRKEAKLLKKEKKYQDTESENGLPTPDSSSANEGGPNERHDKSYKSKKRQRQTETEEKPQSIPQTSTVVKPPPQQQQIPRTGRQLLRGKNIQAKRMAFSDMKGLDEIFMKVG